MANLKLKVEGAKPNSVAYMEMQMMLRAKRKYGITYTENNWFVYEGRDNIASQKYKKTAKKYMKEGRTLFGIVPVGK